MLGTNRRLLAFKNAFRKEGYFSAVTEQAGNCGLIWGTEELERVECPGRKSFLAFVLSGVLAAVVLVHQGLFLENSK